MKDLFADILKIFTKNNISSIDKKTLAIIIHKNIYLELKNYFFNDSLAMKGTDMIDGKLIVQIIRELLSNEEYSIAGISRYTGYPEEVIYDLAAGLNLNPTIELANKILELHYFSNREVYQTLFEKYG